MSERPILTKVTPEALAEMESFHSERMSEIKRAVAEHDVVVIGMALNSACGVARQALEDAGHTVHYIEIGGYFSKWRERLAIKLWSGWPLYPQVFVKGTLIGGRDRTKAALADGTIDTLLGKEKEKKKSKGKKAKAAPKEAASVEE
jgi:glutaredoxin-related protein